MASQAPDKSSKSDQANNKLTDERELIRDLATLVEQPHRTELEIDGSGLGVGVARTIPPSSVQPMVVAAPAAAPAPAAAATDMSKHPGVVPSPMVGTAYRASEPGAKPFVDVGSKV